MAMTIEDLPQTPGEGGEPKSPTEIHLGFLSDALNDRKLFSTPESRAITIAEYCMVAELDDDDPLQALGPHQPNPAQFSDWYRTNSPRVTRLTIENSRDRRTDRYDLEQDLLPYYSTSWLVRFREIDRLQPNKKDIQRAGVAIQLFISEAHWRAIDDAEQREVVLRKQGELIINGLINLVQ